MNRLTPEQRLQILQIYFENYCSVRQTFRALRPFYGPHKRPSEQAIRKIVDRFHTANTLVDNTHPQRRHTVRTEEVIAAVEHSVQEDPSESIRHRAQQLELCPSTLWKILRKDLGLRAHKMADLEKKGRGRPKLSDKEKSKDVEDTKKRNSSSLNDGDTNGEVPAKRGRGRPPKSNKKPTPQKPKTNRGRGRPPKNAKKKEESEEEEEEATESREEEEEEEEEEEDDE